jgi:hypothetical protein
VCEAYRLLTCPVFAVSRLDKLLDSEDVHSTNAMAVGPFGLPPSVESIKPRFKIPKKILLPSKPDFSALIKAKKAEEIRYSEKDLMELFKLDQKVCHIAEGLAGLQAGRRPVSFKVPEIHFNHDDVIYGRADKFSEAVDEVKTAAGNYLEMVQEGMMDSLASYFKIIQEAAEDNYRQELKKFPVKDHVTINSMVETHREQWGLSGNGGHEDQGEGSTQSGHKNAGEGKRSYHNQDNRQNRNNSPKPGTSKQNGNRDREGNGQSKRPFRGGFKRGGPRWT